PLARLIPAGLTRDGRPTRARLVLFRRPLELRAGRPEELMLLIHDVLVEQIANYLGVTPEIVDPTLREDWPRRGRAPQNAADPAEPAPGRGPGPGSGPAGSAGGKCGAAAALRRCPS